jgi:hypothetical protein
MTRVDKLATSSESDLLAAAGLSELKAEVKYADGSFTVINRDSSDWLDVVFEVNGRLLGDGYIFQAEKVAAGATNVIAATRFVNEEGKHFDPAARKPQIFVISATCDGETRVIVVTLE